MGRLGCKCGRVLSTVDSPNDVDLMAFEGAKIKELMVASPDMLLTDVMLDHDIQGKSYWYCNDCGRVYAFRDDHQMYNRVYMRCDCDAKSDDVDDILRLRELYFYTDRQVEEPTESDFRYTLKAFLDSPPHPYRFFITPDGSKVYAFDTTSNSITHYYALESEHDDEASAEA